MTDEWPVVESVTEYETGWYTGGYDRVVQPDGSEKNYYWAALPPAVVVVAVDDGDVLFVDQYRPAIREQCLELPAGIVEDADAGDSQTDDVTSEAFESAGARELREETGFRADEVTLLESFWAATGVLRHRRGIVVAEGLVPGDSDHDGDEFLTVERVPVEDALAVAREPPANDATIEGLLLASADGYL